jgi:hypothetical protein
LRFGPLTGEWAICYIKLWGAVIQSSENREIFWGSPTFLTQKAAEEESNRHRKQVYE